MALILGVVVRHEKIKVLEVFGCVVLLVGAWLVSRSDAVQAKKPIEAQVVISSGVS